jgi:hypothetical protein
MWEYPLVYRSGGWVPDKPREIPSDTYPDGTVSVSIQYPGWVRLYGRKAYLTTGNLAPHRRRWKNTHPPNWEKGR